METTLTYCFIAATVLVYCADVAGRFIMRAVAAIELVEKEETEAHDL